MADPQSRTAKMAESLVNVMCSYPDLKDLTPEQIAALHVFKHKLLAALHRLYMNVPANLCDPIIDKFLEGIIPSPQADG